MKNVKPMVGQVWEASPLCTRTVESVDEIDVYWVDNSYTPMCELHENFKFLPRTDLEWLACNFNSWTTDLLFIWKKGDACYATSDPKVVVSDCYTRQQWQNKRYELGLDDHPIIKLTKDHAASMGRAPDNKKEVAMSTDKMIPIDFSRNITPFVIGDKIWNSFNSQEIEITEALQTEVFNVANESDIYFFVVSFADRQNTSKQPVGNDVVVDVTMRNSKKETGTTVPSSWGDSYAALIIESWKPNHVAMLKQYQAEQEKNNLIEEVVNRLDEAIKFIGSLIEFHDVAPPKPEFTKAMADVGELPPVGSEYQTSLGIYTSLAHGIDNGVNIVFGQIEGNCQMFTTESCFPIDTRSDEEKLRDEVNLIINCHVCFATTAVNEDILKKLLSSDKFTITLKG